MSRLSVAAVAFLALSSQVYGAVLAAPPSRTCDPASQTPISPPPSRYYCGTHGILGDPQPLESPFEASNLKICKVACLENDSCISFGYNRANNKCRLYRARLTAQDYQPQDSGTTVHYNRHCFACPKCPPSTGGTLTTTTTTETIHFTTTLAETTTSTAYKALRTTTIYTAQTTTTVPKKRSEQTSTACPGPSTTTTTLTETRSVPTATEYASTATTTVEAAVETQHVTVDCSQCPPSNSVNNPGFEDSVLSPWTYGRNPDSPFTTDTTGVVDQSSPNAGLYNFRTQSGSSGISNDFRISQSVFVCPGWPYRLFMAVKGTPAGPNMVLASIESFINGETSSSQGLGNTYQYYSQDWTGFDASDYARMITLGVQAAGYSSRDIFVDSVSFGAICD